MIRRPLHRAAGAELTPPVVALCAAVLLACHFAYQQVGYSYVPGGPLDETAHLLTAVLLLQLLPQRLRTPIAAPALVASVAIDLDHIPQFLGTDLLTAGTPRPYTHSLLTILVLLGLALALRRRQTLLVGLAAGIVMHFFRDMGEGMGAGIALFWPLSDHGFEYPQFIYLAVMASATGWGLIRPLVRMRPAANVA